MEKKDTDSSDRRRFISKIAKLGAAGGIATLLLGRLGEKTLIPTVQASPAYLTIDAMNTGTGVTELESSVVGIDTAALKGTATATSGSATGVFGRSNSTNGIGVEGSAGAASGYTKGVYGQSASTDGIGVEGLAFAASGYTKGVYAESASTDGRGVQAWATALSGPAYGVLAESDSTSGTGVYGHATATSGVTYGVDGRSDSTSGAGVSGTAAASSGETFGVYGWSNSTSGRGVYGKSNGTGVMGKAGDIGSIPIVATGAFGQTASLQEWQDNAGTALSAINKDGWMGIGMATPARQLHIQGNQAVSRMDRDVDSAAFIFVRTAPGDFNIVWKSFMFGADARGVNDGRFVIGDLGTAVSGVSTKRLVIENDGKVGIGTESPTEMLHVIGKVRASGGLVTGDIEFANGVKATEEGEGLAFKNDVGEKIAILDREGNLHIKGKFISDL